MFEPDDVLRTLTGRGWVSAEGVDAVRVRYKVVVERRDGTVFAHGTLVGNQASLRPVWLIPDAMLQLKSGRVLSISLTDLVDDIAEFESVGEVAADTA